MNNVKEKKIAVIGTGMIGTSLGVLFTGHGFHTTLYVLNDELEKKNEKAFRAKKNIAQRQGVSTLLDTERIEELLNVPDLQCSSTCEFMSLAVIIAFTPQFFASRAREYASSPKEHAALHIFIGRVLDVAFHIGKILSRKRRNCFSSRTDGIRMITS